MSNDTDEARDREAEVFERIEAFRRRAPASVTPTSPAPTEPAASRRRRSSTPSSSPRSRPRTPTPSRPTPRRSNPRETSGVAFTTDSYVVQPLRFPGGSIGDLAVNGTINDLAMVGARPLGLSVAFVLEEGLSIDLLRGIVADMAIASSWAGVPIVTGDTKVVDRGAADGMYITSAGVGAIPVGRSLSAASVEVGDAVLVSGPIGDHGIAVMVARGNLAIEADIKTDSAPLHGLVADLLDEVPDTRWLRDATRGGVGTVCNELAHDTDLTVVLDEASIPVRPATAGACELLGIDPLYVANEGRLVAVVPGDRAGDALAVMRAHDVGTGAARIGDIRAEPPGIVVLVTPFGGTRIVDMLVGDPLPRIC